MKAAFHRALALAAVLLLLTACSGEGPRESDQAQSTAQNRVSIVYEAAFCAADPQVVDDVASRLRRSGMTVSVTEVSGQDYADGIAAALEAGSRGIVVALPYDTELDAALRGAARKGVRIMELFSQQFESTVSVSLDSYNAGYMLGRRLGERLGARGVSAPRIALAARGDKPLEIGFNEGLYEILPETIVCLKLIGGEKLPEDFLEYGPFDALAVLYPDSFPNGLAMEAPRVACAAFEPRQALAKGGPVLISRPGSSVFGATDQFINSLTGKRVDQRAFYFENTFEAEGW